MKEIIVYRHPDCAKCANHARLHEFFDQPGLLATSKISVFESLNDGHPQIYHDDPKLL